MLILTLSYCHSRTNTELAAKLDADTETSDSAQSTTDVDGDGLQDNFDTCPDEAGAALDNGCPVDSDGDGVTDLEFWQRVRYETRVDLKNDISNIWHLYVRQYNENNESSVFFVDDITGKTIDIFTQRRRAE